ncbi:universal stress protein [Aestuariibaculum suncheonense]|uniref:Universal stress protein n=1 Tax=Aestuariibaculum suncheonense TaxID=1028745 RepID=A0A8J6Q9C1_9FLAO|nr:universal stress protein [Aestuariibaculum suncheonense]MBD0835600.1 universal stress protein [Aestuariibaculum suncheonense]
MKNILLPTDFSENAWNAIKYAINFFAYETCQFYLLHVNRVSSNITDGSPYIATTEVLERLYLKPTKQQLRMVLKRISTECAHNNNHKFYVLTDYNFFIESIRQHVEEKKIDLIVMGTKGAEGLNAMIVGSNTGDVIKKVKCNTLAVPEKATLTDIREVAFPSDFSLNYNIQILQPLLDILENYKASLRILHINKNQTDLNTEQLKNRELLEDYFINTESSIHYLTNKRLEDAVQCFIDSRNINLMCMVAKNLNYFQQILFHSKVEEISYHTQIPFLVLHEKN